MEREIVWHALDHPGLGKGLKRAEQDRVGFAAKINAQIGVAANRQIVERAVDRFGDDVMVLDGVEGNGDATTQPQFARPHTAGEDDVIRLDLDSSSRGNEALVFFPHAAFRVRQ